LGYGWLDAVHPDDRAASGEVFNRANLTQAPFSTEYRLRRHDGEYRWMIDAGQPRFDENGAFAGFVGSVIDINDRKAFELQLRARESHFREMAQELQQSNRMKDEFLATLSHELRTPLNAVLGWAHMLRGRTLSPELEQRALESLERNARAQSQLIDDLLDMSRIVSGRLQIAEESVDLESVVSAAVETMRPAAVSKGVDLIVQSSTRQRLMVRGDAHRLKQVFWNLLSNAIKFTPRSGRVVLEVRADDANAQVEVRDSGEGIDPAFLPHVFERFRQADATSTRRHGGLGLGLSIARYVAEAHGGSISAHSEGRNRGAAFTVQLPRDTSAADAPPATVTPTKQMPLSGTSILVVDDDADAQELFRVALEIAGARVTTAASAEHALEAVGEGTIDLLIADIRMRECDGLELMQRIRALPLPLGQLPAIAATSFGSVRQRTEAFEAGFNAHVAKPLEVDRLLAAVLDVLPGNRKM
jgi:signal transduction histidine kinase/ActR/RegA family two-component response regulator